MRETPFLDVEDFVPLSTTVLRRVWAHWTNMNIPFFFTARHNRFPRPLEHTIVMNMNVYLSNFGPLRFVTYFTISIIPLNRKERILNENISFLATNKVSKKCFQTKLLRHNEFFSGKYPIRFVSIHYWNSVTRITQIIPQGGGTCRKCNRMEAYLQASKWTNYAIYYIYIYSYTRIVQILMHE